MKIKNIRRNKEILYSTLINHNKYPQIHTFKFIFLRKNKLINNIVNKMYVC